MPWWTVLIPSVVIALAIRLLAVFTPKYFSWIELISELQPEGAETRKDRRKVMAQRVAVPLVVTALWSLITPEITWLGGGLIGALAAGLLLWPMVFHGPPLHIYNNDWLLLPVYCSFILLLSISGALGNIAVTPFPAIGGFPYVVSNIAIALLIGSLGVILWWVYDVSAAALGRRVNRRTEN